MLSIVIPTVWGHEPFCRFLEHVVELPVVGEIILINNNVDKTPDHSVLSNHKVQMHNQKENIFVNPAWNLGVSLAKNNTVCILSDDVLVDLRIFFEADRFISKDIGLLSIGINHQLFRAQNNQFDDVDPANLILTGDLKIRASTKGPHTTGMGSLFFIHKDNWIDIPDSLKVYWGDTWQLNIQSGLGRINYYVNDCFYYSPWNMGVKSGASCEYQQTEEFKKFENKEYYTMLLETKLEELKNGW